MKTKTNIPKSAPKWPKLIRENILEDEIISSGIKSAPHILISPSQSSKLAKSSKVIESEISRALNKSTEKTVNGLPSELWIG